MNHVVLTSSLEGIKRISSKKLLILFVFFNLTYSFVYSQEERKMCNAEALVNKPDVVIGKEFVNIGKVYYITISVESVTDLSNNQKLNALDLEYAYHENDKAVTKAVMLDPDETDALITFLQTITDNILKMPAPKGDKEFSFISKSGFECGCYWNNGWSVYIKIDSRNPHTNVDLDKDDYAAFQSFVKQAKAKML